jgi:hypothetical protein
MIIKRARDTSKTKCVDKNSNSRREGGRERDQKLKIKSKIKPLL